MGLWAHISFGFGVPPGPSELRAKKSYLDAIGVATRKRKCYRGLTKKKHAIEVLGE